MEINKKNKIFSVLFWSTAALLMTTIFYFSPFTSDDLINLSYTENNDSVSLWVKYIITYGNGRFLGNGLSLFLINSKIAISILKTVVFLSITFLISELVGKKNDFAVTAIVFIMILFPSSGLFSEVSSWTAGFNNYSIPILFILLSAYLLKELEKHTSLKIALIAFVGLLGQFFSENSSLFAVFLAFAVLLYAVKNKNKKLIIASSVYLVVTSLGFALMMIFPRFIDKKDVFLPNYRSVSTGIRDIVSISLRNSFRFLKTLKYCLPLWMVMSVILINEIRQKESVQLLKINVKNVLSGMLVAGVVYFLINCFSIDEWTAPNIWSRKIIDTIVFIAYLASLIIAIIKCLDKKTATKVIVCFSAALISYLPLLIVSPVGHRTFYLPYVLLVMGAATMVSDIVKEKRIIKITYFRCISAFSALIIASQLSIAMYDIHKAEALRSNYMREQVASEVSVIDVPYLPHPKLIAYDIEYYETYHKKAQKKDYYIEMVRIPWEIWYTDNVIYGNIGN